MAAWPMFCSIPVPLAATDLFGGELIWGAPDWVVPVVAIAVCLSALVIWNYAQRGTFGPARLLATLLKLCAIGLLAICLLQPMRSGTRPRPQANVLPILVDNSQSMELKTTSGTQSRGQKVLALVQADSAWRVRLAQDFDVRTYAFDARLERVESTDQLPMDGYVSSMAGSLQSLAERFNDRPVAGVMLFTDGNLTDLPPADFDWTKLGFPIYPVLPAEDDEIRDLRIADVSVRQTDFESAPTTVRVQVDGVALDDTTVFVQLRDQVSGNVVEEQSITVNKGDKRKKFAFVSAPRKPASTSIAWPPSPKRTGQGFPPAVTRTPMPKVTPPKPRWPTINASSWSTELRVPIGSCMSRDVRTGSSSSCGELWRKMPKCNWLV